MSLTIEIRELILRQTRDGFKQVEISENLGVSQSAVSRICTTFEERGHIIPIKPTGRKPTYNDDDLL